MAMPRPCATRRACVKRRVACHEAGIDAVALAEISQSMTLHVCSASARLGHPPSAKITFRPLPAIALAAPREFKTTRLKFSLTHLCTMTYGDVGIIDIIVMSHKHGGRRVKATIAVFLPKIALLEGKKVEKIT